MTNAVIVSTARTPLCKSWRGAFNMTHGALHRGPDCVAAQRRAMGAAIQLALRQAVKLPIQAAEELLHRRRITAVGAVDRGGDSCCIAHVEPSGSRTPVRSR